MTCSSRLRPSEDETAALSRVLTSLLPAPLQVTGERLPWVQVFNSVTLGYAFVAVVQVTLSFKCKFVQAEPE